MTAERVAGKGLLGAAGLLFLANLAWVARHCEQLRPFELMKPLPPYEVRRAGEPPLLLEALRGQVVLVDFWAEWCGPCRQTNPMLEELRRTYEPRGFRLIKVNVDRDRVVDTATGRPFPTDVIPHILVIDRQGRLRAEHVGVPLSGVPALRRDLASVIERALDEPSP